MGALGIRSFGKDDDEGDSDLMSMFQNEDEADATEDRPTPLAPEDVEEEIEPRPELDEEEQPQPDPEPPEAPDVEVESHVWANKYRSPEELERAYLEVTTGFTKVAQENAAMRQESQALASQFEAQQQQVAQITEFLQAQMAENDPEFAEQLQRQMQMQQMVDEQVEQQVAPLRQAQPNIQQEQQVMRMRAAADDFYRRHTEVGQGSPEDIAMTQGIVEMMNAGVPIDLSNPEHLDLALEVAGNEALGAELKLSPAALQIPGGVARLRDRVGATITAPAASPSENGTRANGPVRQRVETFVETGSGGAPQSGAPGRKPDEFDEAWDAYQKRSAKGPLFGKAAG